MILIINMVMVRFMINIVFDDLHSVLRVLCCNVNYNVNV